MIDFNNSHFQWETLNGIIGRFKIDSFLNVISEKKPKIPFFGLCQVFACDVLGTGELIYNPPFLYQAIFSEEKIKRIRRYSTKDVNVSIDYKNVLFSNAKPFLGHISDEAIVLVNNFDDLQSAVLNNVSLHAKLVYELNGCLLEYFFPINHINLLKAKELFQIETGPIIYLDQMNLRGPNINNVKTAYVAIKNWNYAEFLFFDEKPSNLGDSNKFLIIKKQIELIIYFRKDE